MLLFYALLTNLLNLPDLIHHWIVTLIQFHAQPKLNLKSSLKPVLTNCNGTVDNNATKGHGVDNTTLMCRIERKYCLISTLYLTLAHYFIFDRLLCILLTFIQWGHFAMLIITNFNLISVQSWTYLQYQRLCN